MFKHGRAHLGLILLVIFLISCSAADLETIVPEPSFDPGRLSAFGEGGLPGSEPEPFGQGWFQGGFHSAPVFSPEGDRMWWAGSWGTQKVYLSQFKEGEWMEQEEVSFSEEIRSYLDPFISPDGLKFYFVSTAPVPGQAESGKENYWMMDWESGEWSAPRPLPEGVNSLTIHWTPSVAANYDFYFSANIEGNAEIYKAEFRDGSYLDPVPLGLPINGPELEFTPQIAPDGSYLLFSRAADSNSPTRLFISYEIDGKWSEPLLVENVESCISPIVTPDRGYVIYLEGPTALAWRDTTFIQELKPDQ